MNIAGRWRHFVFVVACLWCCAGLVSAADSQTTSIPYKREVAAGEANLSRVAIGLIICGLAAVGSVYFIRRRLGLNPLPNQPKQLRVLETQRLGTRLVLYVVEFSGQRHLIAHSEHGVTSLASAPVSTGTHSEHVE